MSGYIRWITRSWSGRLAGLWIALNVLAIVRGLTTPARAAWDVAGWSLFLLWTAVLLVLAGIGIWEGR